MATSRGLWRRFRLVFTGGSRGLPFAIHSLTSFSFPERQKSISGNNSSGDRAARETGCGTAPGEIIGVNHWHSKLLKLNLFLYPTGLTNSLASACSVSNCKDRIHENPHRDKTRHAFDVLDSFWVGFLRSPTFLGGHLAWGGNARQ